MNNLQRSKYEVLALLGRVSVPMTVEQLAATLAIAEVAATCDLIELQRRNLVVLVREDHCGQSYWGARRGQYGGEPWGQARLDAEAELRARSDMRRTAREFARYLRGSMYSPQR